jgi:hypothetical protein
MPTDADMAVIGQVMGQMMGAMGEAGRVVMDGNDVVFTATTADQSGQYIHSGRLRRGVIEGQTLSVGRNFLMA